MITKEELLQGRDKSFSDEYTDEISDNLDDLLEAINVVRQEYGKPMKVTSGWRPPSVNQHIAGAAPRSNHMIGLAVDILDKDGALWAWVIENLDIVSKAGLYMEDKRWTPTWVHFQLVKPKSGKRIYIPNSSLPARPDLFDGKYDTKWDK